MARSLEGFRVVVVGASAGIGREFAKQAITDGARTVVAARRGDALASLVSEAGGGTAAPVDICSAESVTALADRVGEELGAADLVLCTAGFSPLRYMRAATADDWRQVLEVNVIGISQLIQALLPVTAPGGLIAVMSSESTLQPRQGLGMYTSSKAALETSLRLWRQEQSAVRLSTLVIGATFPTEFGAAFDADVLGPVLDAWTVGGLMQEKFMTPEDVASALVGVLASVVDLPDVSLDTIVVRSPSAVVGTLQALDRSADTAAAG